MEAHLSRKKVAISACLLGEYCRFDGATKTVEEVIQAFRGYEIIPFCPEAPALGTPRGRISVVYDGSTHRLLRDEDGEDVTELIALETDKLLKAHPDLDAIVLKSKSPSCGWKTTPIYDEDKNILQYGNGIAAQILHDAFPNMTLVDEKEFIDD